MVPLILVTPPYQLNKSAKIRVHGSRRLSFKLGKRDLVEQHNICSQTLMPPKPSFSGHLVVCSKVPC